MSTKSTTSTRGTKPKRVTIKRGRNAYDETVQGLVNQPATVVRLVENAARKHGLQLPPVEQAEVYDRLRANAPRVAIIGGSSDHLAHITDDQSIAGAVVAVWQAGGVPFSFGIPVVCDGAAQSHIGMCYSLFSRNLAAEFVANQMEAHAYHAAIVLQGCDKTPFGVACGLAAVDRARKRRGDSPLWASFIPGHVLKGGTLPGDTRGALESVATRAEKAGMHDDAEDMRHAMEYVVQCTSTEAHVGILQRLTRAGILKETEAKGLQKQISTCACHADGGICAFNGTGNSSRLCMAALGLVHPAVEMLSRPPSIETLGKVVDGLFSVVNDPEASVSALARRNWANAVRVHSATGGSTNLVLHFLALANYAGVKTTVADYDAARRASAVPDILDFSLTEDRTHYELALQVESGEIRGMDTIYHELQRQQVPLDLDVRTVAGGSWRKRLGNKKGLAAKGAKTPPILLDTPRRPLSGVDVLRGNFFDSAVIKMSGMADEQLETFDDKIHCVVFMDNEEAANEALLDPALVSKLPAMTKLSKPVMLAMLRYNAAGADDEIAAFSRLGKDELYEAMVAAGHIKFGLVIAGQGPDAFGMPEMFTPMQHINSNRRLRKVTTLISDGRFSGVSYGAAIGHMTPEASCGGGIGYLKSGDLLRLRLKARSLDLIDTDALKADKLTLQRGFKKGPREALAKGRVRDIAERRKQIARLCIQEVTSADTGVIPLRVFADTDA